MRRPTVIRVYKNAKSGGGVQSRLLELLPRLAEHLDVRLLCYRGRGDRADELEDVGIPVDVVPLGPKWAPWNVLRYRDYFRRHGPDIVHTHEFTANTLGIAAATLAGVPVRVRHLHTLVPWGWGGALRTRLRVLEDRWAARRARTTLAVSEAVRTMYLRETGLSAQSCRVLYNGLDLTRIEAASTRRDEMRTGLGIAPDALLVGLVGRVSRGKGHREFLEVARRVAAVLPSTRFLVVGEGGLREEIEEQCRRLKLKEQVIFTGHRDDVPALLAAMDVFLFTSGPDAAGRIQDGLPGVVIEAQAAGLPVVSFALPMMDELVQHGANGALVGLGDVDGLADAVLHYAGDPGARVAARQASARSAERFSLEKCTQSTLSLYEALLSGRIP